MPRLIDLSKPIRYNTNDPWYMRVKIKHKTHSQARWLICFLGLPFRLFPKYFTGWADDTIQSMGVHATTHFDAPGTMALRWPGSPPKPSTKFRWTGATGPGLLST
jgi:hypothetical protein